MPVLLVDSAGTVHALWIHLNSQDEDNPGPDTVFYARRSLEGVWSKPVDVLIAPSGMTLNDLEAVIDSEDVIHLIAVAASGLHYSRVAASQGASAQNWTAWTRLSTAQAGASAIALGTNDSLHVVYPQVYSPPDAVYHMVSNDGGVSWEAPTPVSSPNDSRIQPVNATIAVAPSGRLHVAWTETIETFPPAGVFYAYSDDQGQTWSPSQMIAGRGHNWISIGIEKDDSRIHLIWTGTGEVVGKYHALSTDAGETWSEPNKVFYGWAGYLGRSRFALDSAGHLHLVTALGGGSNGTEWLGLEWASPGDIFHSVWVEDSWLPPTHVSALITERQLEQATPSLAISEGNLLHVAWSGTYHPEDVVRPVWYASHRVDAPWVEPQSRVGTSPSPTAVPTIEAATKPLPTSDLVATTGSRSWQANSSDTNSLEPPSSNALSLVLISIVPSALLVLAVVELKLSRRTFR